MPGPLPAQFARRVGTTFLTQLARTALAIAGAAVTARALGVEGKGTLDLALLVPGLMGVFLNAGISVSNVYYAGSKRIDATTLMQSSMVFVIFFGVLGLAVTGVAGLFGWLESLIPGVPTWMFLLATAGLPFGLFNAYLSAILQGLQRIVLANIANLLQSVSLLVLNLVLVVVLKQGLLGALLASLVAAAIGSAILGAAARHCTGTLRPGWNSGAMRSMLSFGLRGHVGNVLQFFNYRIDAFILNYLLSPAGVGVYGVSIRFAEALWYLPDAVGFVIFPTSAATESKQMDTFTPRVLLVTLVVTSVGALVLAMCARPLIRIIYSEAFIGAYGPMVALLPGVVLLGAAKVLTNEIAGRGYPKYNSMSSGLALVLTVVLDLSLIPQYGVLGAAIASSIAYGAVFLLSIGMYLFVSRRMPLPAGQTPTDEGTSQGNVAPERLPAETSRALRHGEPGSLCANGEPHDLCVQSSLSAEEGTRQCTRPIL